MAQGASGRTTLRVLTAALPLQSAFGLVYSWGAIAPYLLSDAHWPPLLVGAVFSATPVGYGTGIVVGGRLADRVPPRRLCWAGLGLLAGGLTMAMAFPNGAGFIVFYSMLGLGVGGGLALAGAIAAARYAMPGRVGLAGGLVTAAYAFAAPIQVPVMSALAAGRGWLGAVQAMGAAMIVLAALALALMPRVPRPTAHAEERAGALTLLRRRLIWTGVLLEACATPLGTYAFVVMASYAHSLGLAAWVATVAMTAVATGNAIGRMGAGAASDRLGVEGVMLVALVADIIGTAVLVAAPGAFSLPLVALLVGIAFGAPAGVITRLAQDGAPDAPNHAFGLLFAGFAIGAFFGPLVGSRIGGTAAWLVVGAPAVAGLAVVAYRLRTSSPGGDPVPAQRR